MLLHERLEGVQKDVERLSDDVKGLNRYAVEIDRRVARIEGGMEGYQRASATLRQPRLPKK
jgi:prefoldin subunit 5